MTKELLPSNRNGSRSLIGGMLIIVFAAHLAAQTDAKPAPAAPTASPSSGTTQAPIPAIANLTIRITGIRNAKGRISIALFRDGKGFPRDIASAVAGQRVDIDPQTLSATAVFTNLPQGTYAASVLHDENLTGKMEFDAQGIPQEGYGISNNPDTSQGPPTAEDAKFAVSQAETAINIKMTYWN